MRVCQEQGMTLWDADDLKEMKDLLIRIDIRLDLLDRKIGDFEARMLEAKKGYLNTSFDPNQWRLDKYDRDYKPERPKGSS